MATQLKACSRVSAVFIMSEGVSTLAVVRIVITRSLISARRKKQKYAKTLYYERGC